MSSHDRFLSSGSRFDDANALGRVFNVVQETWKTTDDPKKTEPAEQELATRRTASDAADLAREAALAFPQHGFHKPSGAWWASDGALFHRFLVTAGPRRRAPGLVVGLGVAALALTALGATMRARRA